jgi:hypothetical protein
MGNERDGVVQKLPVLLPVVIETVAVSGETQDQRDEALKPPADVWPDVGGLDVSLSSTALGGFNESMRQLVDYPYGCLEQLSSRLVPFIALRELQGSFGLQHEGPENKTAAEAQMRAWIGDDALKAYETVHPDDVVKVTVKKIEALQNIDGGYRYWDSNSCSDAWASSYAVLALGRALEVGYPVDTAALARGQKFLADNIVADHLPSCGYGVRTASLVERAFALNALARTHKPKASSSASLFAARAQLPLFGKALLADAMFLGAGDKKSAQVVLQEVLNSAVETPREVHFEDQDAGKWSAYWSSDVRTTAIVLQTLTDATTDHPFVAKIARYLNTARQQNGRYRNTQEASFALMALTEVVRSHEKDAPSFKAVVALAGKSVVEQSFLGRSMDVENKHVAMSALPTTTGALPFSFKKSGEGTLYYNAVLRYAPKAMPTEAIDRGIAVQRWFEPFEGGGQARKFYAGDLVRVRVRVGTSAERRFVSIDVPLPAGLEAVDPSLASSASLSKSGKSLDDGEEQEEGGALDEYLMWSPFNHTEKRDDRVVVFADALPPGVNMVTFIARATTKGSFVLKPALASEMYAPEVFGQSDGGRFDVVEIVPRK